MEETHARRIGTDHFFGGLRLALHAFEPGGCFLELPPERSYVAGFGARDFLAQLIRLLLEELFLIESIRLPQIGARAAGFRHQLLLAVSPAPRLGAHGVSPVRFLVVAPAI